MFFFLVFINVIFLKHVSVVFFVGIQDILSIDSITYVLISCYEYNAQTDAYLNCSNRAAPKTSMLGSQSPI